MKKFLLLAASMMLAASAMNAQNVYENVHYSVLSPNGKYAVGQNEYAGIIDVINLETGETQAFYGENENELYTLGLGANPISNDGVVLISTTYEGTAAYIENGEVKLLPLAEGCGVSICNAITPDGSRIVGSIGVPMDIDAKVVMQRPVVWNRLADGTYSAPVELPYPTVDFTGRLPQYVLVDGISKDGKTLACQIIDYSGMLPQPMMLQEGADGTWTYTVLGDELMNPFQIELPEYPGEEPKAEDFMTEDEKAVYAVVLEAAANAVEPDPIDYLTEEAYAEYMAAMAYGYAWAPEFMTEEEAERYDADMTAYYDAKYPNIENYISEETADAYNAALEEWGPQYEEYEGAFYAIMDAAVNFQMNALATSPNGKYYVTMGAAIDAETWEETTKAYVFDVENGTVTDKGVEGTILVPTQVTDNGGVLAVKQPNVWLEDMTELAYISTSLEAELVPLHEYVQETDPALYKWMEENLHHQVITYEWDWEEEEDVEVVRNLWLTGTPACDEDMKTLSLTLYNSWDYESDVLMYSYVMPFAIEETINVSDAGIATFCSTRNLDFSNSTVKAYAATSQEGESVKLTEVTSVPAGMGVILKGAEGNYTVPCAAAEYDGENYLVGVTVETDVPANEDGNMNYILARNKEKSVAFYPLQASHTLAAGKAYLSLPGAALAKVNLVFDDEDATGIQTIESVKENAQVGFNLMGVRVNEDYKGIIIQNGKKMFNK